MRYHNTPVFSALAPVEMMAEASLSFDMATAALSQAIDKCRPAIAEVLNIIAEAPEGAVLFHCSAPARTGQVSLPSCCWRMRASTTTIIEDYALTAIDFRAC